MLLRRTTKAITWCLSFVNPLNHCPPPEPLSLPPQPSSSVLSIPPGTLQFLKDLHTQLWGKQLLEGDVFRAATITPSDYVTYVNELKILRDKYHPEPLTQEQISSYQANFLHHRSRPTKDISATAGIAEAGGGDAKKQGKDDQKAGLPD
ncbi:hypothetical protein BDN72DRAFT_905389 [Pluteus cervinus]|uniref:Uncharacterized protein n=1 Tax=Pluteus cervinus TaxID=181527 RepID=A0ACD3A2S4_9AGAR|nr:hypothetical protein BDN72DRAFT_905389 [Pluteus cervinus]